MSAEAEACPPSPGAKVLGIRSTVSAQDEVPGLRTGQLWEGLLCQKGLLCGRHSPTPMPPVAGHCQEHPGDPLSGLQSESRGRALPGGLGMASAFGWKHGFLTLS